MTNGVSEVLVLYMLSESFDRSQDVSDSQVFIPQIRELNSYVGLRKTYTSSIGNKQELLDGGSFSGGPARDVDVRVASS